MVVLLRYHGRMQRLIPIRNLAEGELLRCEHDDIPILVGLADQRPFAIRNLCTHAYVSFGHATLRGSKITCPWHGLSFDVHTGHCDTWPGLDPITRFAVEKRADELWIGDALPHTAPPDA